MKESHFSYLKRNDFKFLWFISKVSRNSLPLLNVYRYTDEKKCNDRQPNVGFLCLIFVSFFFILFLRHIHKLLHFLRIIKFISANQGESMRNFFLQLNSQKLIIKMSFWWKDNLSWIDLHNFQARPHISLAHDNAVNYWTWKDFPYQSVLLLTFKKALIVTRTWAIDQQQRQ